jgi:hypothetical protein
MMAVLSPAAQSRLCWGAASAWQSDPVPSCLPNNPWAHETHQRVRACRGERAGAHKVAVTMSVKR